MTEFDKEYYIVLYEDLCKLERISKQGDEIDVATVREASAVLRRLLIDGGGGLKNLFSKRRVKFIIEIPDFSPLIKVASSSSVVFYQGGYVKIFGLYVCGSMVSASDRPEKVDGFDLESKVYINFNQFLNQYVMKLKDHFVRRVDVVKYVANKAGGVHYDKKRDEEVFKVVDNIRKCCVYELSGGVVNINFNPDGAGGIDVFSYSPQRIDAVLCELLSVAQMISGSSLVVNLKAELEALLMA